MSTFADSYPDQLKDCVADTDCLYPVSIPLGSDGSMYPTTFTDNSCITWTRKTLPMSKCLPTCLCNLDSYGGMSATVPEEKEYVPLTCASTTEAGSGCVKEFMKNEGAFKECKGNRDCDESGDVCGLIQDLDWGKMIELRSGVLMLDTYMCIP
jgi:hypothetical protein